MRKSTIFGIVIAILAVIVGAEAFIYFGGTDYFKASAYSPSSEMSDIMGKLNLTDYGTRVLKAVHPSLDTQDEFNSSCGSHDSNIYVLGCYLTAKDEVHLYNIGSKDLEGVKESTAAHELLHAVWNRLPVWDRRNLESELKTAYDQLPESSDIRTSMSLYSDDNFYDELHSRLGTEMKSLPENLEKHYSTIFKNQDEVVAYYDEYSGTFKEIEAKLGALQVKIKSEKSSIEAESTNLDKEASDLNSKIEDYNKRVSSGNYTSEASARTEGDNLKTETENLSKKYDALNEKIKSYNDLIDDYNSSVVRSNELMDEMNSNTKKVIKQQN